MDGILMSVVGELIDLFIDGAACQLYNNIFWQFSAVLSSL